MSPLTVLPNTGPVDVTVVANWRVLNDVWITPNGPRLPWVNVAGAWIRAAVDLRGAAFAPTLLAGDDTPAGLNRLALTLDRPRYTHHVLEHVTTYRLAVDNCAITPHRGPRIVLTAHCHPVSVEITAGWQTTDPRFPQFKGRHR